MHRFFALLALVFAVLASPAHAECTGGSGERGVALLIGISDYETPEDSKGWSKLPNAVNDIDYVCDEFLRAGYKVFPLRDPTWEQLDLAIADFHAAALDAPSAIVYYAGHGFEFNGRQYIVPVDAPRTTRRNQLRSRFIPLQNVLDAASSAQEFSLFFMDACRTRDPVISIEDADRDGDGSAPGTIGLFTVPRGAVIFSTVAGRPAYDDAPAGAPQSPFAAAVARNMAVPQLELGDFYENLHHDVVDLTKAMMPNGPQYPALYKVAPAKFYLVETLTEDTVSPRAEATPAPTVEGTPVPVTRGAESPALDLPSMERLAVEDGPVLIGEILKKNTLETLTQGAAAGDPVAQYVLGYIYQHGTGAKPDKAKARHWFEQSAAQDHPLGQTALAYFLDREEQGQAERVLALYEAAAAKGFAKAQSQLGYALWYGTLGAKDRDRAISLFEQASASGHVFATYALAQYAPDKAELAEGRLRKIAAAGNAEGDNWLCELYYVKRKAASVVNHCEAAALAGYPAARAIWAGMLARGEGVERDDKQAQYWARLALTELDPVTRKELYDYTAKKIL
ncbi:MAG: caspase family protein [Sphingomonadaceae bacterium]|nr:caspase family protein [Sphingomonadaceae bacterium]